MLVLFCIYLPLVKETSYFRKMPCNTDTVSNEHLCTTDTTLNKINKPYMEKGETATYPNSQAGARV